MNPVDIEQFLAIKRQIGRARWVEAGVGVLGVFLLAALFVASRSHGEAANILPGFVIAATVVGMGGRGDVARKRLIELIEKQINRDPAALRYLAQGHPSR